MFNLLLIFFSSIKTYTDSYNQDKFDFKNFEHKKYDIIIDDVFDGLNKIELDYYLIKQKLNKNNKNINIVKKIKMIFGNGVNMPINNIKSQSVYLFDNKI